MTVAPDAFKRMQSILTLISGESQAAGTPDAFKRMRSILTLSGFYHIHIVSKYIVCKRRRPARRCVCAMAGPVVIRRDPFFWISYHLLLRRENFSLFRINRCYEERNFSDFVSSVATKREFFFISYHLAATK